MSALTICRRCGEPIASKLHRVRIVLVNAGPGAPPADVDKEDDFHHACAAHIFHVFDGTETPAALVSAAEGTGGQT